MSTPLPEFDVLMQMAKENPEALEQLRLDEVNTIIENAPVHIQQRLRGLQFQIDSQRQLHSSSSLGACIKISEMMHESFQNLRSLLNQISQANDYSPAHSVEEENPQPARIIKFPMQ